MYTMPNNVIEKGFLSEIYKERKSMGIILDGSQGNQMIYDGIRAAQLFLPSDIEVCFFVQELVSLPLTPTTGLYHTSHLYSYKGNLISSSISSVHDATRSGCGGKIFYYIRDLRDLSMHTKETVENVLRSPDVIKVCASENYSKFVLQNYPSAIISNKVISDFNLSDFGDLIFGE